MSFKILEKNSGLNLDKTNIVPCNFAVTEEEGTFTFHYSDASFCNGGFLSNINKKNHRHNYTLDVEGKNLVDYLYKNHADILPKLSFIKVDAEGYDKEIIKSMGEVLKKYKPYIVTECYKRLNQEEREDFYHIVTGLGYVPYHIGDFENPERTLIASPGDMANWQHFDMLLVPAA